jgi:hypothetical protein
MSKIAYSGIVLDERSRERLLKHFKDLIPEDWEIIAHHMTINMGEINPKYERYLGIPLPLKVESFGINDKVAAVEVSGFPSEKEIPHVTLAVNRKEGGKPAMSDNIESWYPIKRPIKLVGKVQEIPLNLEEEQV